MIPAQFDYVAPDTVADAVAALAAAPERRAALGAAGPVFVAERFSMAQYVGSFQALYDELIARPRAAYGWFRGSRWPRAYNAWLVGAAARRLRR